MPTLSDTDTKDWWIIESFTRKVPHPFLINLEDIYTGSLARGETPLSLVNINQSYIELEERDGIIFVIDDGIAKPISQYKHYEIIFDSYIYDSSSLSQKELLRKAREYLLQNKLKNVKSYIKARALNAINSIKDNPEYYKFRGEPIRQFDLTTNTFYYSYHNQRGVKFSFLRAFQYIAIYVNLLYSFSRDNLADPNIQPNLENRLYSVAEYSFNQEVFNQILKIYNELLTIYYSGLEHYHKNIKKGYDDAPSEQTIEYNPSERFDKLIQEAINLIINKLTIYLES